MQIDCLIRAMSYVFPDGQYFDQQKSFFFDATMEWNECTAKSLLLLLPSSQGRPRGSSPRAAPKHLDEADEADEAKIGQGKKTERLPRSSKGGAAKRVNSLESLLSANMNHVPGSPKPERQTHR